MKSLYHRKGHRRRQFKRQPMMAKNVVKMKVPAFRPEP
jgi:hypothetical protein